MINLTLLRKPLLLGFICCLSSVACNQKQEKPNDLPNNAALSPTEIREQVMPDISLDATRRVTLDGNVDAMRITEHTLKQSGWVEQSSFSIERIADLTDIVQSSPLTSFVGGKLSSRVKIGTKTYQSDTFYHRATGLLIHRMLCDHPGSLHVRATDVNASPSTAMRLLPFESNLDLHTNQQIVRGEGECAVVICFDQAIETYWKTVCARYDPDGGAHPDIIRVIEKLDEEASAQNHEIAPHSQKNGR